MFASRLIGPIELKRPLILILADCIVVTHVLYDIRSESQSARLTGQSPAEPHPFLQCFCHSHG